jgi:amidase
MARTVADAALLLGVLTGASYGQALQANGLKGARLGVVRQMFGFNDHVDRLMESVIGTLKRLGAEVVDPVAIPTYPREFKSGLNAYLEARGAAVKSLQDVIDFNNRNPSREMQYFGQDLLIKAAARGPLNSNVYRDLLARLDRAVFQDGLDAVVAKQRLDAFVAPTDGPAWPIDYVGGDHAVAESSTPSAVAGYPHVTVPAGQVFGLPVGLSFFGSARSEVKLTRFAFAFEQAVQARRTPEYLP